MTLESKHAEGLRRAADLAEGGDLEACIEQVDIIRMEIVSAFNRWQEIAQDEHYESGFYPAYVEPVMKPDYDTEIDEYFKT